VSAVDARGSAKQSAGIANCNAGGKKNSCRGRRHGARDDLNDSRRNAGVQRTSGIVLENAARRWDLRTRAMVLPRAPATCRKVRPCIGAE